MMFECATDGCTTKTERRGPRHKYCDVCATKRKHDYNKVWYETVGAEWKRINYLESQGGVLVKPRTAEAREKTRQKKLKRRRKYQQRPEVKEKQKRYNQQPSAKERGLCLRAEIVQLRRERRIAEADAGGRTFNRRDAPVSYPYLSGNAKYNSNYS
jgi:hypothetical protein